MREGLGWTVALLASALLLGACANADAVGTAEANQVVGRLSGPFVSVAVEDGGWRPYCGGTFVGVDVVLTAAHCVGGRGPDDLRVSAFATGVVADVTEVRVHPAYTARGPEYGGDLALLRVAASADTWLQVGASTLQDEAAAEVVLNRADDVDAVAGVIREPVLVSPFGPECPLGALATEAVGGGVCVRGVDGLALAVCAGDSGSALLAGDRVVAVVSIGRPCGEAGIEVVGASLGESGRWVSSFVTGL